MRAPVSAHQTQSCAIYYHTQVRTRANLHPGFYFSLYEWFHPIYRSSDPHKYVDHTHSDAVLAVTTPHMCGLGGDLFALVHHADGSPPDVVDAAGRAGSGADAQRLRAEGHAERCRATQRSFGE